ncbi:MAG: chemotaxis protein CheW [Proteobacteria bacterium]|nr:chemotaxis protein CheW [Pseudomonadota bacterium]
MQESLGLHTVVPLESQGDAADENKYIIFALGEEYYGAKLLEVREVVEFLPTKSVPNTVPSFQGVCNLRGQIIGVVDLRIRFSIDAPKATRSVLLVFDTESGAIASSVDQIASVSVILPNDVEWRPNIVSSIPSKYIIGIGKLDQKMITIIDLKAVLSHDELTNIERSKMLVKEA